MEISPAFGVPTSGRRFCADFASYKNEGRAGYCFKQFDKRPVEFLYLVPPALAPQVSVSMGGGERGVGALRGKCE